MAEEVYGIALHDTDIMTWRISFPQWIEKWNKCEDVHTALGLLHGIFSTHEREENQSFDNHRILFLLKLADGHNNVRPNDPRKVHPQLRYKAFSILASEFFKYKGRDRMYKLSAELVTALETFFMAGNVDWKAGDDTRFGYSMRIASEFLLEFCQSVWNFWSIEHRLWVLEFLHPRSALLTLMPTQYGIIRWRGFENSIILERLKELVLRNVKSVEEGVFANNDAAILLTVVRTGLKGKVKKEKRERL